MVYIGTEQYPFTEIPRRVITKVIRVQESHLNRILCLVRIILRLLSLIH